MTDKWTDELLAKVKRLESEFERNEQKFTSRDHANYLLEGVGAAPLPSEFARLRHRARTLLSQPGIPRHYYEGFLFSEQIPVAKSGQHVRGVLRALAEDLEDGNIPPIGVMVRAETHSDLLDLAESLLDNGNSLPAAAVAGAVLEGHLRGLCDQADIKVKVGNKGGSLGKYAKALKDGNLLAKDVYRTVSDWITLRNDAAHMKVDKVSEPPVRAMIAGLRSFMAFGSRT